MSPPHRTFAPHIRSLSHYVRVGVGIGQRLLLLVERGRLTLGCILALVLVTGLERLLLRVGCAQLSAAQVGRNVGRLAAAERLLLHTAILADDRLRARVGGGRLFKHRHRVLLVVVRREVDGIAGSGPSGH